MLFIAQTLCTDVLSVHKGYIPSERVVGSSLMVICIGLHEIPQVPQLDGLIFAVTDQVAAISFGVQMRHAICVAHQQTGRLGASQIPPVPYL